MNIDLCPYLWCLKAMFIIADLRISKQMNILKIVSPPRCAVSTRECPFCFTFPNIYCYFRSFALLTVTKYYFISIICIIYIDTEVELSLYAYYLLLCLFCTQSFGFGEESYSGGRREPERISLSFTLPLIQSWPILLHLINPLFPHKPYFQESNGKKVD